MQRQPALYPADCQPAKFPLLPFWYWQGFSSHDILLTVEYPLLKEMVLNPANTKSGPAKRTPSLDAIEMTMTLGSRCERLLEHEYLLLEQLISFKEQTQTGETLKDTLGMKHSAPDRIIRAAMSRLIQKTNALHPTFPLIRKIDADLWIYTEVAPKKKRRPRSTV